MAKPKGVNQKARYRAHSIRLTRYVDRVQSVYDTLNQEVASAVVRTSYDGEKPFRFSDYPLTKKKMEEVQAAFVKDMRSVIYSGTSEEWKESNLVQDLLADKALKFYGVKHGDQKRRVYYQSNNDALKAFQRRKDDGMGLSEKLWNQSKGYKEEMEFAISSGIEKGTSAVKLSKRLSKYLQDFPSLKHDYKEKFGKAVTCQDCEYRSIRLARSEINMAYRTAEQERWKQFDFVLGYEVKLTQNGRHVPDICDDLAGKYPKDFKFTGWHPNCMCYVVPVLQSEEDFWNEESASEIVEPPKNFTDWLEKNAERLDKAAENDTLPYWYTDNLKYVHSRPSETFDLLAKPEGLPSKYSDRFDELLVKAEKELADDQRQFRTFQVNVKRLSEMLADSSVRGEVEEQMGDYFLVYMEDYAKGKSMFAFEDQVRKFQEITGFVRPQLTGVRLPKTGSLPCDASKISRYLNSLESLEEFYINYGYKSYEEFFEAMGGLESIEERLLSLSKESRVYMCLESGTFEKQIIKGDGKFKNSLETGKGSFKTIGEERATKERIMFGMAEDADYDVMPKYGFVAGRDTMDYEQIVSFGYGDTYVRFKDSAIRSRTSITCGDSYDGNKLLRGNTGYRESAPAVSLDEPDANFSLGILSHSRDGEAALKKLMSATKLSEIQTSTYIEAQIYGPLRIEEVDAVYVQSKKQMESLTKLLKKKGLDIEILPCEYDTRLKYLADGFTNYEGKAAKYARSLTDGDVDLLGDFYIDGLTKKFADPRNGWWKKISMPEDFMSDMQKIAEGSASSDMKRKWLKTYYAEIRKKKDGAFPKVWWEEYSPSFGGWVSDVLNEKLLKGL